MENFYHHGFEKTKEDKNDTIWIPILLKMIDNCESIDNDDVIIGIDFIFSTSHIYMEQFLL